MSESSPSKTKTRPAKVSWGDISSATSFSTREEAQDALARTLAAMRASAESKTAYFEQQGGKLYTLGQASSLERSQEWLDLARNLSQATKEAALAEAKLPPPGPKTSTELLFRRHGAIRMPARPTDFLPRAFQAFSNVRVEWVAGAEDMLSPMKLYFVRAGAKWSNGEKHLVPEFHQAKPFFSKQDADENAKHFAPHLPIAIVESTMLMSAVHFAQERPRTDDLANQLHAACESRDIASAIHTLAQDRADSTAARSTRKSL